MSFIEIFLIVFVIIILFLLVYIILYLQNIESPVSIHNYEKKINDLQNSINTTNKKIEGILRRFNEFNQTINSKNFKNNIQHIQKEDKILL